MSKSYSFVLAGTGDDAWPAQLKSARYLCGIDVTAPELAARCELRIDPSRDGDTIVGTAIERAARCKLPPSGAVVFTTTAGLDTVGAMAVLATRARCSVSGDGFKSRIAAIAAAARSAPDWDPTQDLVAGSDLEALRRIAQDGACNVSERVGIVRRWLEGGSCPQLEQAVADVQRGRAEQILLDALVRTAAGGHIATIRARSPLAVKVASRHAPVVIKVNDHFTVGDGEHRRVFISQRRAGLVNLRVVRDDLNRIERGWDGSATNLDSATGISSSPSTACTVDLARIVAVVERRLTVRDGAVMRQIETPLDEEQQTAAVRQAFELLQRAAREQLRDRPEALKRLGHSLAVASSASLEELNEAADDIVEAISETETVEDQQRALQALADRVNRGRL